VLRDADVRLLVDVRAYPFSRRHPQFSRPALEAFLSPTAIEYCWEGRALGGMRRDGYAAHMETALFQCAAAALPDGACIMCAEADPAQCHRLHIADWLVANGRRVSHLLAPGERREHAPRLF
jgi:uncharacterized protein (DUF488 family)